MNRINFSFDPSSRVMRVSLPDGNVQKVLGEDESPMQIAINIADLAMSKGAIDITERNDFVTRARVIFGGN